MFNTRQVFYMGVPKMSFSYAKRIVINSLFKKIALPGCLPKACQELSHKVKPFTLSYVLLRDFRNNHLVCVTSSFPVQRNTSYSKIDKAFNIRHELRHLAWKFYFFSQLICQPFLLLKHPSLKKIEGLLNKITS